MSKKSIAKARAVVMLCNKDKGDWEYPGGLKEIATVQIYHHPVNNTYRIVGTLEKDQSVVINFALVKGLSYKRETPTFHKWTDHSQLYGLNFESKQDAQVFENGVFTSLENLKTIERVPPQPQPRIQKLLPQLDPPSYGSNWRREPDEISSHHRDQPKFDHDAYEKYSPGEAPERIYSVNQNEMQLERQRPGESAVPLPILPEPHPMKQSRESTSDRLIKIPPTMGPPPKPKPKPKPKPSIGRKDSEDMSSNHRDQPQSDAINKHSPGEESAVPLPILPEPHPMKQSKTGPSEMTKDEAHSSSVPEGGITNKAHLNQGEKKEENEEGKGKGQEEISNGGTGLAFSGGGIRSAAFCSGVLCSLLKSGVEVDYLSCVSGGGFTGAAYLDWKCHEEKKVDRREGQGKGGWHEDFFNHMKDRSGYICDWTDFWKGLCDTLVFFTLMALVLVVLPVIKWGTYAFPVAVMIDLFGIGNLMRKSADCDAALERQREINASAVPDKDLIDRCLSGNHKRDITILFSSLFAGFVVLYVVISNLKKKFLSYPCLKSVLLLFEYAAACVLIFTFIPFTIYDFFVKIALWQQVLVGIIAVIVWVAIPFLRRKTSYVLIVYAYSFVIYWRVFRVDVPVFFFKHEDHVSHWLLFFSGVALMISFFTTNLKEELVHRYFRWRVQKAFFHENNNTKPLTLADLEGTKPEYISNIVVNRWKNNEKDKTNYTLLTMSPSGIQRFDQQGKRQFEGKLKPEDIMLSEAMATSAAALSSHMGKYEESVEGLTRLHTILGLDMGATMISDEGYRKKCPRLIATFILDFVRGFLLIIPTICYRHGSKRYEPALLGCMIAFLVIHALLAFIAVLDLACEEDSEPKGCDWFVRWLTAHIPFVYNVRLLFSKDNHGSIPPAVLLLSDGGHYENLAILPLLQRKLKKIVVVDGGYKEDEEDYGKSILDALMLARTELNCSFCVEDGKDLISDLMRTFVNPSKRAKSRYYKFKVHYDEENDSEADRDGEIILLVPRKPEDIQSKEEKEALTCCCCCECCHCKSCLCACLSKCLCNAFPQHSTANQFFTPRMFQAYHEEGSRACEDAKADVFLQTVSSVVDVRDISTEEPNRGDSYSVDERSPLLERS